MSKMLEETRHQPEALDRTLTQGWRALDELRRRFERRRPKVVVLVARGTSDNAAQFGRYLIEIATGIPVSLAAPSVFTLYRAELDFREVLYVGLSQSGESTDVNTCIQRARELGAITLGVTNDPDSTLARTAEQSMFLHAGRE